MLSLFSQRSSGHWVTLGEYICTNSPVLGRDLACVLHHHHALRASACILQPLFSHDPSEHWVVSCLPLSLCRSGPMKTTGLHPVVCELTSFQKWPRSSLSLVRETLDRNNYVVHWLHTPILTKGSRSHGAFQKLQVFLVYSLNSNISLGPGEVPPKDGPVSRCVRKADGLLRAMLGDRTLMVGDGNITMTELANHC